MSIHGGEEKYGSPLIIVFKRAPAYAIAAKTPDARKTMLTLLDVWMTERDVRIASVEAYYGKARLAVAKTRVFGNPTVKFD